MTPPPGLAMVTATAGGPPPVEGATLPTMFSTTYSAPVGGTTRTVKNSGGDYDDLQDAIDAAAMNDIIVVDVDYEFTGTLKLKHKTGTGWIYIISADLASLPEGVRVTASDANHMPTITSVDDANSTPAIMTMSTDTTAPHNYRFCGFNIRSNNSTYMCYYIVACGFKFPLETSPWIDYGYPATLAQLPSYIWFDRCYINNDLGAKDCRVGVDIDGQYMAVIDSHVSGITEDGADNMGIWAWNGGGPYKVDNNYLEASGQNIMLGGSDATITDGDPSDLQFTRNYCYKLDHWNDTAGHSVKNFFEMKHAVRVLCEGNWMENVRKNSGQQNCTAIVLTVRDQSGTNTWSKVRDITIRYNRIRTCSSGMRITGYDNDYPSQQTQRISVHDNCWDDIETFNSVVPMAFQISSTADGPALNVSITHNLFIDKAGAAYTTFFSAPDPSDRAGENITISDNIMFHGNYGVWGNGVASGKTSMARFIPTGLVALKNAIVLQSIDTYYSDPFVGYFDATTPWASKDTGYPAGWWGPHEWTGVGFTALDQTDWDNSDYVLAGGSPFNSAGSDGKDLGPDWALLTAAVLHSKTGDWR